MSLQPRRTHHPGTLGANTARRFKITATGEEATALSPKRAIGQVHEHMHDGKDDIDVYFLRIDGTGEVRLYTDDALESLD